MTNRTLLRALHPAKAILYTLFFVLPAAGWAQVYGEEETPADTPMYDYYDENIDGLDAYGDESSSEAEPKKPEKKPYVRIVMPVDTITELIAYTEVIEQPDSYYDSLYLRAKRWINGKWGGKREKDNAKLYSDDVLYEKFKTKVSVPLKIRYNKYSSDIYGDMEFTLTLRFKDGKYKYYFTNLTHLLPETSDKKDINYVYMEYYMKSERNIVNYDRYLRAADAAINKLITEMKKALREPIEIDEDDW